MDLTFFFYVCLSYHTFFFICLFEVVNVVRKGNGISFYGKTQIHELPYVTFACLCRWYLIYMRLIIPFTLLLNLIPILYQIFQMSCLSG